ncbi:MAG: tyrosine-type recombinase/integrase [Anaerolineales bacterium]
MAPLKGALSSAHATRGSILMLLFDLGCRCPECCALDAAGANPSTGAVMVVNGKGKWCTAFVGAKAWRALIAYLRHLTDKSSSAPLWLDEQGSRLSHTALRAMLVRRARLAGVPAASPHDFRRAFAIAALRGGMDLISLERLLGHTSLAAVSRYLKQVEGDLAVAHREAGLVDKLL